MAIFEDKLINFEVSSKLEERHQLNNHSERAYEHAVNYWYTYRAKSS